MLHACAMEHTNNTTCGRYCAEYFGMRTMYRVWTAPRVTVGHTTHSNNSRMYVPCIYVGLAQARPNYIHGRR